MPFSGDTFTILNEISTGYACNNALVPLLGADLDDVATGLTTTATSLTTVSGIVGNGGSWTPYTPTVTSGSGAITSYTSSGASYRFGKILFVRFIVTITNAGTGAGDLVVTLPATEAALQFIGGVETAIVGKGITGLITGGTARATYDDNTTIIATNANVVCSGNYETT